MVPEMQFLFLPAADADALMDWFLRTEAVEPREDGASVVQDMAGEEKDRKCTPD